MSNVHLGVNIDLYDLAFLADMFAFGIDLPKEDNVIYFLNEKGLKG